MKKNNTKKFDIKNKSGYTMLEMVVVVILTRIIRFAVIGMYFKYVEDSKIAVVKNTIEDHIGKVKLYFVKNGGINDLNDDNNYLDDLILEEKVVDLDRKIFEEPTLLKYEIRQILENPDKTSIYLVLESSNEKDKYIIDEAIKQLNITDNNFYKETF